MLDFLSHNEAPISDAQWDAVDRTIVEVARRQLVGRRFLPIYGPLGAGTQFVTLDKFESPTTTRADASVDASLVVTAPPALQRARVMARPGMTEALFQTLLAKQLPDRDKRARATHLIETLSLPSVRACVQALIRYIRETHHA